PLLPRPGLAAQNIITNTRIEIDRIDVLGVHVFHAQVIEDVLEIVPGDRLERQKVVKTEENLQALYASHGYEQVKIKSRLIRKRTEKNVLETVLEFSVVEGKPVRIATIRMVQEDGRQ